MRRRSFLLTPLAAFSQTQRDRFGGWRGLQFKPTGFFRLEKQRRWWLATPDGNAFLGFGLNHVMMNLLLRKECVDHWAREFGVKDNSDASQFIPGYRNKVKSDLDALGMNHLGVHSSMRDLPEGFCPYLHRIPFVNIPHFLVSTEKDFHDVFAPEFEAHCDRLAKAEALPRKDSPWLIGYFFTDCPIFTDLDAAPRQNNIYGAVRPGLPTWPRVLRNLGGQSAGKRAYVDMMHKLHGGDIIAFNRAYGASFSSFEELQRTKSWRPRADPQNRTETRDNLAFLEKVVDRYYSVAAAAVRRYDPNHLIVGDKLNGNTDPQDALVKLAGKHMDVLFYQMYGHWEEQRPLVDRWSSLTGKPLFNGDSSYAVPYPEMPNPYGPHCASQQDRARRFTEFAEHAFARPDFVGFTWCGWIDGLAAYQREKQHGGLQTPCGGHYQPLTSAMARFSERMYFIASGRKDTA